MKKHLELVKKHSKAIAAALVIASTLALPTSQAMAQGQLCSDVFKGLSTPKVAKYERSLIYAKGTDPVKNPGGHMQVSYESEYLFNESAALLRDYAPATDVMATDAWLALSNEQRISWVKDRFQDKPEFAADSGLFKIVNQKFMPEKLIVDSTGNLEIVLDPPMNTYQDWEHAVDWIVKRYGAGSQQAMISKSRDSAFRPESGMQKKLTREHLGWLVYTNLKDMFAKMQSGYERYQKSPTKLTALSFDHPFVGPMIKIKRDVMETYLERNARGELYDDEAKQFVRKRDSSFKYTSGPSYRPDIAGPGRFSWELRNSHKDVEDLKMKVKRDMNAHAKGLEPFEVFADVPAFDSIATFARLPVRIQTMLSTLFPSKADPRFEYAVEDLRALETFRNFALPLQDFSRLADALGADVGDRTSLSIRIRTAQVSYAKGLDEAERAVTGGTLTAELARARVMGLIGEFAVASGIQNAFDRKAAVLGHENTELEKSALRPAIGF